LNRHCTISSDGLQVLLLAADLAVMAILQNIQKKHQRMYPLVPLLANHQGRQFGSGPKGSEMMQHELLLALGHCLLVRPESLLPQPVASRSSHSGEATGLRSSHSHGSM
jgi:hypothetical protein